jgi:DNA mismatch repair protein MutL
VSLNGRAASVRTVSAVLEQLLAGPAGYPLLACRLVLEPGDVDVNAHPSKLEVRLREPSRIAALVEQAAESAVSRRRSEMSGAADARGSLPYASERAAHAPQLFERAIELQSVPARSVSAPGAQVMQVGRSYLVSSLSGGLVIIDPHAAHERVLFDSIRKGAAGTQQLLLPEPLDLDPESMEQLQMHRDMLREAGFDFTETGQGLMLCAVPSGLRHGVEAVSEILSHLSDPVRAYLPPHEMIAAAAACAGAVKLGDPLDPAQAAELVDMLFATSDPFRCPHGRPTLIEITDDELGRRFGR